MRWRFPTNAQRCFRGNRPSRAGCGSGSGALVPVEDTERPQRVPPAGLAVAVLERKVDFAGMRVFEQPGAVGLLFGSEQLNRFVYTRVRRISGRTEVVEGAQHVIVPTGGKRELEPGWVDDFPGALTPEELSLEEILLTPAPSCDGFPRTTGCALVRQQSFQWLSLQFRAGQQRQRRLHRGQRQSRLDAELQLRRPQPSPNRRPLRRCLQPHVQLRFIWELNNCAAWRLAERASLQH